MITSGDLGMIYHTKKISKKELTENYPENNIPTARLKLSRVVEGLTKKPNHI